MKKLLSLVLVVVFVLSLTASAVGNSPKILLEELGILPVVEVVEEVAEEMSLEEIRLETQRILNALGIMMGDNWAFPDPINARYTRAEAAAVTSRTVGVRFDLS